MILWVFSPGLLDPIVTDGFFRTALPTCNRPLFLPPIWVTQEYPGLNISSESWTINKAEHRRIDAFELWCWRRLLRVPGTARRSILKEISPECSLEGLMLKLKLQYFGPPHAKSWLIGKDPDAGEYWGQEEKGTTEDEMAGWHCWLDGRESEWTLGVGDGQGGLECCDSWGRKESDTTEQLNWTEGECKTVSYFCMLRKLHFAKTIFQDKGTAFNCFKPTLKDAET